MLIFLRATLRLLRAGMLKNYYWIIDMQSTVYKIFSGFKTTFSTDENFVCNYMLCCELEVADLH
jgi:hypothetical protein